MKFCVNVHMRILPHMLKKGFGVIPQQAAPGRPVAMLAIPGNAVFRGCVLACPGRLPKTQKCLPALFFGEGRYGIIWGSVL